MLTLLRKIREFMGIPQAWRFRKSPYSFEAYRRSRSYAVVKTMSWHWTCKEKFMLGAQDNQTSSGVDSLKDTCIKTAA